MRSGGKLSLGNNTALPMGNSVLQTASHACIKIAARRQIIHYTLFLSTTERNRRQVAGSFKCATAVIILCCNYLYLLFMCQWDRSGKKMLSQDEPQAGCGPPVTSVLLSLERSREQSASCSCWTWAEIWVWAVISLCSTARASHVMHTKSWQVFS